MLCGRLSSLRIRLSSAVLQLLSVLLRWSFSLPVLSLGVAVRVLLRACKILTVVEQRAWACWINRVVEESQNAGNVACMGLFFPLNFLLRRLFFFPSAIVQDSPSPLLPLSRHRPCLHHTTTHYPPCHPPHPPPLLTTALLTSTPACKLLCPHLGLRFATLFFFLSTGFHEEPYAPWLSGPRLPSLLVYLYHLY